MATSAGASRIGLVWKTNGELLQLAESEFDVLITLDTNVRYQQNLTRRKNRDSGHSGALESSCDLSQHFPACAQPFRRLNQEISSK